MTGEKKVVVLLVEDDPLVRAVVHDVLGDEGDFDVISTESADEALACLETRSDVQVLVTDHNMPGSMTGLDLAQTAHRQWPGLLIFLTTGRGMLDGSLPPGATYLAKPYQPWHLVDLINAALEAADEQTEGAPATPMTPNLSGIESDLGNSGSLGQPLSEPET